MIKLINANGKAMRNTTNLYVMKLHQNNEQANTISLLASPIIGPEFSNNCFSSQLNNSPGL